MDLGILHMWRDTFYSSLKIEEAALGSLGMSRSKSTEIFETSRQRDEQPLKVDHHTHNDDQGLFHLSAEAARDLEEMSEKDDNG
jgi:glutathione-regulated potassium-efflux system protein KefB